MSQANIDKFYKYVAQNPALLAKLAAGVNAPDEFIDRAVAAAGEQGFPITRSEAQTWIDEQIAARKNGELSDVQLEAVAGGKGASANVSVSPTGISAGGSVDFGNVGRWLSSW